MSSEAGYPYINPKPTTRAHKNPLRQMDQFPHMLLNTIEVTEKKEEM